MASSGINPNNVIRVPLEDEYAFFRYWLEFLSPFHHLTGTETTVAAAYLKERHVLSKDISSIDLLNKFLMSHETQKKIRLECNVTEQHFQVIKGKLTKKKFFIDKKINPKLVPNFTDLDKGFQLLLLFKKQ